MGRKADPARREQLLAATASYLEQNGLAGLSLRPLAAAVGVSPRTLLYHFGSKEQLLTEALGASQALQQAVAEFVADDEPLVTRVRRLWARTADPSARPYLRLFFEVYAAALRDPRRYAAFLSGVVDDWISLLAPMLEAEGLAAADAATTATQLLALHHGCTLDLLVTGDHDRVTAAYHSRLAQLEARLDASRHPDHRRMRTVATIGVYGWTLETFLDALRTANVGLVLDVRQRRGVRGSEYAWANSARLQAALAGAGIEYRHHKELAPTTELRHLQYREDARLGAGKRSRVELAPEYRQRYTTEILDQVELTPIVVELPIDAASALLCVEHDPEACHRSLIAERLAAEHPVSVIHLLAACSQ